MLNVLYVSLGGAIGAAGRYLISLARIGGAFPAATLITNLLGAALIGFVVGMAERGGVSGGTELFLKTGVCGGFTTFSTFSLETLRLFENGRMGMGCVYAAVSVVACVAGVTLGEKLARAV